AVGRQDIAVGNIAIGTPTEVIAVVVYFIVLQTERGNTQYNFLLGDTMVEPDLGTIDHKLERRGLAKRCARPYGQSVFKAPYVEPVCGRQIGVLPMLPAGAHGNGDQCFGGQSSAEVSQKRP